jgi:peptidyl-prolyl cis-trans isomerase A (cyclophilin A)
LLRAPTRSGVVALVAASILYSPAVGAGQGGVASVTVTITTTLGDITAEIFVDRAPITADNFLHYVDGGIYDGATFYRSVRPDNQPNDSVRIEVVQAGPNPSMRDRLRPPIPLERTIVTGVRHVDGALSMARGGPDTATASFFICIGDQGSLDFGGGRNPDGQGFAAFGRVVDGMEVVRRIQMGGVDGQRLIEPVRIASIRRTFPLRRPVIHRTP